MDLIGKTLGHYRIETEIGHGGMAVVYRAVDTRTQTPVALKVLLSHLGSNVAQRRRFIREADQVSKLQHPNIVDVYEVDTSDGYWYIAMELIEGVSLSTYLSEQPSRLSVDRAIEIVAAVAEGLDYAHAQGLIHRDIKPGNILLTGSGRVLITDFGLAKLIDVEQTAYTQIGTAIGTPAYMSPEQAYGKPLDRRSDIYSLGVVAYLLLTGKTPFAADSAAALLHMVVYEPYLPPEEANPDIAPGIAFALKRVLSKDPPARYSSASDFAVALEEGKSWVPSLTAQQAVVQDRLHTTSSPALPASTSAEPQGNRRLVGWLLLLSALVIAIVLVLALTTSYINIPGFSPSQEAATGETGPSRFLTLIPYEGPDGVYTVNIPKGWTQFSQEIGQLHLINFDASDAHARLFLLSDRAWNPQIDEIEPSHYLAYLASSAFSFSKIQPRSELTVDRRGEVESAHQTFDALWLGRPMIVTLNGFAGDEIFHLVGSAVEADLYTADDSFLQLHDQVVQSFQPAPESEDGESQTAAALPDATDTPISSEVSHTPSVTTTNALAVAEESADTGDISGSLGLTISMDNLTAGAMPADTRTITQTITPESNRTREPDAVTSADSTASSAEPLAVSLMPQPTDTVIPTPTISPTPEPTNTAAATATTTPTITPTTSPTSVPTGTPTERPTATPVPTMTVTVTPAPTDTATPTQTQRPTQTRKPTSTRLLESIATATSAPTRTATATSTPTLTPTRKPTSTPLPKPTATKTSAPTHTATSTQTRRPTSTPLPKPTATRTPRPTRKSTPTPIPTRKPTSTTVPTHTPLPTTVPPTRAPAVPAGSVTPLEPLESSLQGQRTFSWTSGITLSDSHYFEMVFWPVGGDPMAQGFGPVGAKKDNQVSVNLDKAVEAIPQLQYGQEYEWGVLLVTLEPYRRLSHLGTGSRFQIASSGGGGGGGGGSPPVPTRP